MYVLFSRLGSGVCILLWCTLGVGVCVVLYIECRYMYRVVLYVMCGCTCHDVYYFYAYLIDRKRSTGCFLDVETNSVCTKRTKEKGRRKELIER